jgi:hypothetical protein
MYLDIDYERDEFETSMITVSNSKEINAIFKSGIHLFSQSFGALRSSGRSYPPIPRSR